jgi:hypothetical protein
VIIMNLYNFVEHQNIGEFMFLTEELTQRLPEKVYATCSY